MGADSFHVYYGLRWCISREDERLMEALELGTEARLVAAAQHSLDHWWGETEDEEVYFLLIGARVSQLGWEYGESSSATLDSLREIDARVSGKLRQAGFQEKPALHFQFLPDR
jgi:hypothetical protein